METMKITKCETRTQIICEIDGHSYVRTTIDWPTNNPQTITWHLNEDQKDDDLYLKRTDDKLEELFWLANVKPNPNSNEELNLG